MSILDTATMMDRVRAYVGEDNSDEALSFIEDISDTMNARTITEEEANRRVAEKDTEWRNKYRERFLNPTDPIDPPADPPPTPTKLTFDSLFKND